MDLYYTYPIFKGVEFDAFEFEAGVKAHKATF